jgi:hypothetical protein
MQKLSKKMGKFFSRKDATNMEPSTPFIGRAQKFFTLWRNAIGLKILRQIAVRTQMFFVPPTVTLALNTIPKQ